jgi:hypothetical protein
MKKPQARSSDWAKTELLEQCPGDVAASGAQPALDGNLR